MIEISSPIRIYKGWIDYNTFLENKGKTTLTSLLQLLILYMLILHNFMDFLYIFMILILFKT